ncbi:hypothetical protein N7491_005542 [Penicillium cf. griseofulvum]|uniref:Uncharacterized protein n=1 Tax=Penicillium cf. griseofulvum TaxID=2972120 RepID=A0A9W9J2L7_9EURO|nr:hypothetical protein N7472_008229 [Penicillium cf. griseofulvum]KAJ5434947.1 hypothetical protein N7491_005542 [Penicillium cf. griseofulvum]KAJ5452780.1 hypothetical protein N7445_000963 [Penicillium cf. griseofulvum]
MYTAALLIIVSCNISISPPKNRGSANTGSNRLCRRITAITAGPLPRKIGPESTQCPDLGIGAALLPIWGELIVIFTNTAR